MRTKRGFSIIELIIVMAIVSVIATLILAAIKTTKRTATETVHRSNAATLEDALISHYSRNHTYKPTAIIGTYVDFACACLVSSILNNHQLPATPECNGKQMNGHDVTGGGYIEFTNGGYILHIADYTCTTEIEKIDMSH